MTNEVLLRLFVHVEEPSMKEALEALLPPLLEGRSVDYKVIDHGSKQALLQNLPLRMHGYGNWPEPGLRVLVLVDRDNDDCSDLKQKLERAAAAAGLPTKTAPNYEKQFKVVNRIVIEELEAWFLGDIPALIGAFPRLPQTLAQRARYRYPDAIAGGAWEALFRALNKAGYYVGSSGLPKIEVARRVAPRMVVSRNKSRSFQIFITGLNALLAT